MPVYEYKCKKCGNIFEVIATIKDKKIKACTKCGSDSYKILSATAKPIIHGFSEENGYSKTN